MVPGGARRGKGRCTVYQGARKLAEWENRGLGGAWWNGWRRAHPGILAAGVLQLRQVAKTPAPKIDVHGAGEGAVE